MDNAKEKRYKKGRALSGNFLFFNWDFFQFWKRKMIGNWEDAFLKNSWFPVNCIFCTKYHRNFRCDHLTFLGTYLTKLICWNCGTAFIIRVRINRPWILYKGSGIRERLACRRVQGLFNSWVFKIFSKEGEMTHHVKEEHSAWREEKALDSRRHRAYDSRPANYSLVHTVLVPADDRYPYCL